MEAQRTPVHNLWHSLAEVEKLSVDQMDQGIYIRNLRKGDTVKFETSRGNDGYAFWITLEVTHPKQGGVRIVQAIKFLGRLNIEVAKETFGPNIHGFFVVRGRKPNGELKLGWIGIGADVSLADDNGAALTVLKSIKNISINGSLLVFPPSSKTIQ